ncbi:SanA/YdcF family protein [Demequina sp.]|uniref:SanA/YdcF family protein n=1 Tax=Demequina sp. TaxID=2050685 RepID=UPI003D0E5795
MAELVEVAPAQVRKTARRRWITAILVALFIVALLPWTLIRALTWTDVGPVGGNLDHADAALVLGARVYPDGSPSPFLLERVTAGVELYERGIVDRIIMSGDGNDSSGHGEPTVMRSLAEGMGVPAEAIVEDPLGVDTYSSCVRARDEFGADTVIVTTQEFHVSRATWLCKRAGLDAQGAFPPITLRKGTVVGNLREVPAAAKAWMDVVSGREP